MNEVRFTLTENARLAPNVYRLRLAGDASAITAPGQFLELSIPGFFLRRPLSVCDWEDGSVTILYRAVGDGTRALAEMKPGQTIDALCGLGNGFDVTACGEKTLVIGGGIGVPPMYGLARRLRHLLQPLSRFAGGGFRLLEHLPLGGALGMPLCPLLGGGHSSRRRFLCRLARHCGSVLRRGGLLR